MNLGLHANLNKEEKCDALFWMKKRGMEESTLGDGLRGESTIESLRFGEFRARLERGGEETPLSPTTAGTATASPRAWPLRPLSDSSLAPDGKALSLQV